MRLAKYLASCGVASRRASEDIIKSGYVTIDGKIVTDVATNVVGNEKIAIDDSPVVPNRLVYYLVNKPTGYTCSVFDLHAEKLIAELVPKEVPVWPVGRLDRETSGLLIMSNDGDFTNKMTHPRYNKEKEYQITVDRPLSTTEISKMVKGITLDDGPFRPDRFTEISPGKYSMVIHEGRNRLIRRSVEHFGKQVMHLSRVRIGSIGLTGLAEGKYRPLTTKELEGLKNA